MAFQKAELEGATDTTFSGPLDSHDTVGAVALDQQHIVPPHQRNAGGNHGHAPD